MCEYYSRREAWRWSSGSWLSSSEFTLRSSPSALPWSPSIWLHSSSTPWGHVSLSSQHVAPAVGGADIHITTTVYLSLTFMTNDTLGRTGPHKFSGHSQMHFCGYSGGIVMPRHTERKVKEKEASARAPTPRLNRQLLSFLYLDKIKQAMYIRNTIRPSLFTIYRK